MQPASPPIRASPTAAAARSIAGAGHKILANSRGFVGEYRRSICSISASPIAQSADGQMQRDYWYSSARSAAALESPESIGAEAARRTLRRLGARSVPTQQVPVVFSPEIARSIVGHIFEAANGSLIYHQSSFFAGKLGEQVASPELTIIDDGTLVGGFGTAPFDGEGLPTRRTVDRRARRAQELSAQHIHGAQAQHAIHRQRLARDHRRARHRRRQSLP